MLETIWEGITSYMHFYGGFLRSQWAHISPVKYGIMLICVAVFGWLLMKSSVKRC